MICPADCEFVRNLAVYYEAIIASRNVCIMEVNFPSNEIDVLFREMSENGGQIELLYQLNIQLRIEYSCKGCKQYRIIYFEVWKGKLCITKVYL